MKKRIIILAICVFAVVAFVCVFKYYHPTHFAYNDRFVVCNTVEKIVDKYGEFYSTHGGADGEISCGVYKIRGNTSELMMGYDDSLWYEIYFEDGVAVQVSLREGNIGG